ncbi:VCBS domain-containing protein, partial [Sulfitobacter sp. F26169L]|uniref:VCBS domain-containing protein n=1 Tax=Sulfitobacter sp. F26169L TaxID=2996015 RepID=UPI002260F6EA
MIKTVTLKSDSSTTQVSGTTELQLDAPSVVTLGFGPEEVARFDKVGSDLVLLLKDGSKVTIANFFGTFEDGRNDIVFIDENEVVWWGQYTEPWDCFQIAEIEHDLLVPPLWVAGMSPILGVISGAGLIAAIAGSNGDTDPPIVIEPPVVDENTAPVARDDADTVVEAGVADGGNQPDGGTPQTQGNVLANDTDADGDPLTVTGVQAGDIDGVVGSALEGEFGTLVLNSDGSYTYVLNNDLSATQSLGAGDNGTEVFTYTVGDGNGGTDTATLTINVQGTNDLPAINGAEAGAVQEDGALTTGGQLGVSDVDLGDTHTWAIVGDSAGTFGTFSVDASGAWTYQVNNDLDAVQGLAVGETLTDTVTIRVTDAAGGWAEQTVTVTISGSNDTPVIDSDASALNGSLIEGVDGSPLENSQELVASGTIRFTGDAGGFTATAEPVVNDGSYLGSIELLPPVDDVVDWTFTVDDAALDSLPEGATLTQKYLVTVTDANGDLAREIITITLVGRNDSPIAGDDTSLISVGQTASKDVLANDTDIDEGETANLVVTHVDGQPISVGAPVTLGDGSGTVSIDENGHLSFEPAPGFTGDVVVSYTVDDGSGTDTSRATGDWTINVVNAIITDDASVADPDVKDGVLATIDDLQNVAITGRVPTGGSVTAITVTDGTNTVSIPLEQVTINPDGTYILAADLGGLDDGVLTVDVALEDAQGNTVVTTDTILKDTGTKVSIDPVTVIDGAVPTITGQAQPGDTVVLTIDGGDPVEVNVGPDGTWSYSPETPLSPSEVTFIATATDPFGNVATDTRKVAGLVPEDQQPNAPHDIAVSESGLPTGTDPQSGTDRIQSSLNVGTTEGNFVQVSLSGTPLTLEQLLNIDSASIPDIQTPYGSLTVTGYNPETGDISFIYRLDENTLLHASTSGDSLTDTIEVAVVDADGDTRISNLVVAIADDVPAITINADAPPGLTTSDAALGMVVSQGFADLFDVEMGADGAAATTPLLYSLQVGTAGVNSGLTDMASGDP